MRLHRIRLKNFRGVESHDVKLAPSGITVIEGDNGVGKTSLIEAVKIIFLYPDSSTRNDVRMNQPLGSDVGVEIEVEVSLGDYRMRYAKSYIRSRSTTLEVLEPARETLTGRQAHDRAGQILNTSVDTALLWALWLDQGVSLDQADLSKQTSLGAALDRAAGHSADGDTEEPLFQLCEAEYNRYFTSRGRYRQPFQEAIAQYDAWVAEVEKLSNSLEELDSKNEECERLAKDIERLKFTLSKQVETLEDLESRRSEVNRVSSEADRLGTKLELANERLERAKSDWGRRQSDIGAIAKLRVELDCLNLTANGLDSGVAEAEQALARAQRKVESAREAMNDSRRLLDLRRADHNHLLESAGVEGMETRLENANESLKRVRAAQSFLDDCRITDSLLAEIEDKERDVLVSRAQLDSEGASVEIVSHTAQQLVIDGAARDVADGERIEKTGLYSLAFSVPGVIDVAVTAGQGSRQLASDLDTQEAELAALLQSAGAADASAVRQLNDQRSRTESDLERERATLRQVLGDSSIPELEDRISQTRERSDRYLAERDSEIAMPPDANAASGEAQQAERQVSAKESELNTADANAVSTRETFDANISEQRGLNVRVEIATSQLKSAMQSLESARESESDEAIEARVKSLSKAATAANALLSDAESQLAEMDPDGLVARLSAAEKVQKRLDGDLRAREVELRDAQVFLRVRGEEGLYDKLDAAKSELERAEREKTGEASRAAAAKLLYETISRHRDETRARYLAPFREKIESLGKVVFGPGFSVELDDDLRVKSATLKNAPLEFERHSTGEREQIGLISRLACASIVSEDGGVPLVLDDALGWSDPTRLEQIGAALTMGAEDCQVIALTCMPDRYSRVGAERVIRLT